MDLVCAADLDELAGGEVAGVIGLNQAVQAKVQSTGLRLALVADRKKVAAREGAGTTQAFIARSQGVSMREAGKELQLARDLQAAPQTEAAMKDAGVTGVSKDKAHVIARAMTKLPGFIRDDQRRVIEADLISSAQAHSVEDLRRAAKRATEVIDTRLADKLEGETLRKEELEARRQATFWMSEPDDAGMVEGRFKVPLLEGAILSTALESFTSPRHNSMVGIDETGVDYPKRLGRGFCDLLTHLPTDKFPQHGGVAATIIVNLDHDQLHQAVGAGTVISTGDRVSARLVRHLACGANILPAVLDGDPLPLDLGHDKRAFDAATRKAMALRDGGCAFPRCNMPLGWTEAHHIHPWAEGGVTDINHGVLLCPNHHRLIEQGDWTVHIAADKHPVFMPPPWVEPRQHPQRNTRWKAQRSTDGQRRAKSADDG
ncbi:HNH endonuclease signature motif containing protein [soil metagenome]